MPTPPQTSIFSKEWSREYNSRLKSDHITLTQRLRLNLENLNKWREFFVGSMDNCTLAVVDITIVTLITRLLSHYATLLRSSVQSNDNSVLHETPLLRSSVQSNDNSVLHETPLSRSSVQSNDNSVLHETPPKDYKIFVMTKRANYPNQYDLQDYHFVKSEAQITKMPGSCYFCLREKKFHGVVLNQYSNNLVIMINENDSSYYIFHDGRIVRLGNFLNEDLGTEIKNENLYKEIIKNVAQDRNPTLDNEGLGTEIKNETLHKEIIKNVAQDRNPTLDQVAGPQLMNCQHPLDDLLYFMTPIPIFTDVFLRNILAAPFFLVTVLLVTAIHACQNLYKTFCDLTDSSVHGEDDVVYICS